MDVRSIESYEDFRDGWWKMAPEQQLELVGRVHRMHASAPARLRFMRWVERIEYEGPPAEPPPSPPSGSPCLPLPFRVFKGDTEASLTDREMMRIRP